MAGSRVCGMCCLSLNYLPNAITICIIRRFAPLEPVKAQEALTMATTAIPLPEAQFTALRRCYGPVCADMQRSNSTRLSPSTVTNLLKLRDLRGARDHLDPVVKAGTLVGYAVTDVRYAFAEGDAERSLIVLLGPERRLVTLIVPTDVLQDASVPGGGENEQPPLKECPAVSICNSAHNGPPDCTAWPCFVAEGDTCPLPNTGCPGPPCNPSSGNDEDDDEEEDDGPVLGSLDTSSLLT